MQRIEEIDSWALFESGELTPQEYEQMEYEQICRSTDAEYEEELLRYNPEFAKAYSAWIDFCSDPYPEDAYDKDGNLKPEYLTSSSTYDPNDDDIPF